MLVAVTVAPFNETATEPKLEPDKVTFFPAIKPEFRLSAAVDVAELLTKPVTLTSPVARITPAVVSVVPDGKAAPVAVEPKVCTP